MPPKVSVAIVTYNQEQYIKEAVDSVLAQDYPDFEIVVADDGSTDGTRDVLRAYERDHPGLFKLLLAEVNGGITANCNRAYFACTGKYIAWLAGDDMMLPGRLAKQVAVLEEDPGIAICVSASDVFESATNASLFTVSADFRGKRELTCGEYIESGNCIIASATMVRRSMCPPQGHDARVPVISDFLFFIETSRNGGIRAQEEVLTRYRRHGAQVTSKNVMTHPDPWITLAIVEYKYPDLIPHVHTVRSDYLFSRGMLLLHDGRYSESRMFLRTSFFYRRLLRNLVGLLFSYLPGRLQSWLFTTRDRHRKPVNRMV